MGTAPREKLSAPTKAMIGVRVLGGAALLIAPGAVLGDLLPREIDGAARAFARLLGARHLLEAAVLWRDHTHPWLLVGAGVDSAHAATMVVLAVRRRDERGLALINAATASALAAAGLAASRGVRRCPTYRREADEGEVEVAR